MLQNLPRLEIRMKAIITTLYISFEMKKMPRQKGHLGYPEKKKLSLYKIKLRKSFALFIYSSRGSSTSHV